MNTDRFTVVTAAGKTRESFVIVEESSKRPGQTAFSMNYSAEMTEETLRTVLAARNQTPAEIDDLIERARHSPENF
jgi:hypothetical protein